MKDGNMNQTGEPDRDDEHQVCFSNAIKAKLEEFKQLSLNEDQVAGSSSGLSIKSASQLLFDLSSIINSPKTILLLLFFTGLLLQHRHQHQGALSDNFYTGKEHHLITSNGMGSGAVGCIDHKTHSDINPNNIQYKDISHQDIVLQWDSNTSTLENSDNLAKILEKNKIIYISLCYNNSRQPDSAIKADLKLRNLKLISACHTGLGDYAPTSPDLQFIENYIQWTPQPGRIDFTFRVEQPISLQEAIDFKVEYADASKSATTPPLRICNPFDPE
jgi:hypothetical protein